MKYNVITHTESGYAILDHKGKTEWSKRVAMKHAREFKADHMRDSWINPADEPIHERGEK